METMEAKKTPKTMRLTETAHRLLHAMAARRGISETAVMEMAIREKAAADGLDAQKAETANDR
jgi:hypothetical protein